MRPAEARVSVLDAVAEIGEVFSSSRRLQPVLERIIQTAMELASGDSGSLMLLSSGGDELVVAAAVGRAQASSSASASRLKLAWRGEHCS